MRVLKSAAIAKQEGSSDKTYTIALLEENGGYRVYAEWGRRGAAQQGGDKYVGPIDEAAAKKFDKTLQEKLKEGYKPYSGPSFLDRLGGQTMVAAPVPTTATAVREVVSRVQPMKCGPVGEDEAEPFILNDRFAMEQKFDGKRRLVIRQGSSLTATNSSGQRTNVLPELAEALLRLPVAEFELDLEDEVVGGGAVILDVLSANGSRLDGRRYDDRRLALLDFAKECQAKDGMVDDRVKLRLAENAIGQQAKRAMLAAMHEANAEGVILKDRLAVYHSGEAGRSYWQKVKFVVTGTFIVNRINTKRSVELAVLDGLRRVPVGSCTVSPSVAIPSKDSLVEVQYLYARRGGSLIQPTNLRSRSDELDIRTKAGQEAVQISHLKYKQGD